MKFPDSRQVGESYKDYAARMAGAARAAEIDRDSAQAELVLLRNAVLAIHRSEPIRFVVGDRREFRDCCAECEDYWPCPTARAVGVTA
jgi:hypothetical protein